MSRGSNTSRHSGSLHLRAPVTSPKERGHAPRRALRLAFRRPDARVACGTEQPTAPRAVHVPPTITQSPQPPLFSGEPVGTYDATGHFQKNSLDAYSLNNITTKKAADGSVAIQFSGCDGKVPNCLPIMKGWNYMVRLCGPHPEILNGSWKFPEAQPHP